MRVSVVILVIWTSFLDDRPPLLLLLLLLWVTMTVCDPVCVTFALIWQKAYEIRL